MRQFTLFALVLALSASASALTPSTSNVLQPEQKPAGQEYQNPPERSYPGDTLSDPFFIGSLPFTASGSTCGYTNDYDYACPYTGSTAPDVVFKFAPTTDRFLTIDLCASTYDTKVYVFRNTIGNVIACNDDYCAWQSRLANVPFLAGNAYYIVVDGYGGSCGTYTMALSEYQPCDVVCKPGAIVEGEPACYDGYNDVYNGGCNVTPFPVFQIIYPGGGDITICGTTGVFQFDTYLTRDTDWFQLDLNWTSNICLSGDAEVPCYFFIIDGRGGCWSSTIVAYGVAGPCAPVADICYTCDPGTWWMWAGPNAWDTNFACGSLYNLTISGYYWGVDPIEPTTWGRVKGLFR
jgi:hypothetical protein